MEDDSVKSVEYAKYKREVYHMVFNVIFRSVEQRSHYGEAVICGDNITRVLHPGFLVCAIDGEEAYCLCGTRGAAAKCPCPRCLIQKPTMDNLSANLKIRTQADMEELYQLATAMNPNVAERYLKDSGLHLVQVIIVIIIALPF